MDTKTLALYAALSANSSGQNRNKLIESLIEEGDSFTPRQQLMLEFLQQHAQSTGEEDDYVDTFDEDFPPEFDQANEDVKAWSAEAKDQLRRKFLEMQVELKELRERNEIFAHALGACPCWGYDADCPECHGNGRSGYYEVDPQLYAHFVAPALPPAGLSSPTGFREDDDDVVKSPGSKGDET